MTIIEKGISPPSENDLADTNSLLKWLKRLQTAFPKMNTAQVLSVDPPSISPGTTEIVVPTPNITAQDIIVINRSVFTDGLFLGDYWCTSGNIHLVFVNVSASPINPGPQTYFYFTVRR